MTATKIQPGDDTHLTLLMAPHSLNFVTGSDRAALLAYGRDVFAAARDSKCLAQIEEPAQPIAGYRISDPSDPTIKPWLSDTPDDNGYTSEPLYAGAAPAAVAVPTISEIDWDVLPENPDERARFDRRLTKLYGGDPRISIATALRLWAETRGSGFFGAQCAVFANEIAKMHIAAPALEAPAAKPGDMVAVPRDLIGAACGAISKKRDAPTLLAELRRYTTGDLSRALEAPAAPDLRQTRDKAGILHYLTPEQMAEEIVRLDARLAAAPQAQYSAPDWWRKRADEIEAQVATTGSSEAMRCYTDMRTLLQSAAAPQAPAGVQAEPVAWMYQRHGGNGGALFKPAGQEADDLRVGRPNIMAPCPNHYGWTALYAAPQAPAAPVGKATEARISAVMELVKEWSQCDLIAAESGIDALSEECSEKDRKAALLFTEKAEEAYRAIESALRTLLSAAPAAPAVDAETVKKAARYDWLRGSNIANGTVLAEHFGGSRMQDFDAVIDAKIASRAAQAAAKGNGGHE